MGIETAAIVMAAVATAGKITEEVEAANARKRAINLQSKEAQVQYQQKTLSNLDTMQKVLDAQAAALTTRGVTFSSPSFNAIQRNTFNISSKQQQNLDLEESVLDSTFKLEKENVNDTLFAQLFGDVANAAMMGANYAGKRPTATGSGSASASQKLPQMETY